MLVLEMLQKFLVEASRGHILLGQCHTLWGPIRTFCAFSMEDLKVIQPVCCVFVGAIEPPISFVGRGDHSAFPSTGNNRVHGFPVLIHILDKGGFVDEGRGWRLVLWSYQRW